MVSWRSAHPYRNRVINKRRQGNIASGKCRKKAKTYKYARARLLIGPELQIDDIGQMLPSFSIKKYAEMKIMK
jgi:hypothetical protein